LTDIFASDFDWDRKDFTNRSGEEMERRAILAGVIINFLVDYETSMTLPLGVRQEAHNRQIIDRMDHAEESG